MWRAAITSTTITQALKITLTAFQICFLIILRIACKKIHLSCLTPLCYSKSLRNPKSAFAYLPLTSTSLVSYWPDAHPVPVLYTRDHLSCTLGSSAPPQRLISTAHDITRLVFPDPSPRFSCGVGYCLHVTPWMLARLSLDAPAAPSVLLGLFWRDRGVERTAMLDALLYLRALSVA